MKKERDGTPGQPPLRSRHEPLGDSRLSLSAHVMVIQSNHEVEVVCWFLEQALLCSPRFVSVLLALPYSFASSRNNLQLLKSHSRVGWPSLVSRELSWYYEGPLHPTCRCTEARVPLRGTNVHEEFRSTSSAPFGKQIGALCLASTLQEGCGRPGSRSRLRCRCAG